ncbi:MAG TPA: BACON domain-containing protein [Thermoanaerobaculia bacterium]|nr:BACON domain-containing protein [Thermoanaerobaculia bacterium]
MTGNVEVFVQDAAGRLVPESGGGGGGAPSLGVTPASLSFSGTAGGPNPAVQGLSITSTGTALSWSATDNASWLTMSPASGSTPSSATASVNLAGLAAGTYNATITISSGAQSRTVPVTLTVGGSTSGLSVQVLSPNGGQIFSVGDFVDIRWTSTGATSHRVQYSRDGINYTPIVTGLPGSAMSYFWTVPPSVIPFGQLAVSLRLRVIARNDTTASTVQDESDGLITIRN